MVERLCIGEALLLMEERRTGKTSLAIGALDRIRAADGRVAAVTLTRFPDPAQAALFLERQLQSRSRRTLGSIADLIRRLDQEPVGDLLGGHATHPGGALHLAGSRFRVPDITTTQWLGALRDGFAELEIEISETHLLRLIEETGGQPYLTMRLARDTARIAVGDPESPRKVDNGQIETALLELRADPVWEQLRGQQP